MVYSAELRKCFRREPATLNKESNNSNRIPTLLSWHPCTYKGANQSRTAPNQQDEATEVPKVDVVVANLMTESVVPQKLTHQRQANLKSLTTMESIKNIVLLVGPPMALWTKGTHHTRI